MTKGDKVAGPSDASGGDGTSYGRVGQFRDVFSVSLRFQRCSRQLAKLADEAECHWDVTFAIDV